MGINSFWLFYIEADSVLVSLINWGNGRYYVASIGPRVECDIENHESILKATDESLSSAASSADIPEDQEPIFVGLVIPSSWVGEDSKIIKSRSEIVLPLLKKLDLKPSGFISNDEAIIEESSKPDDFPASFINLYLETNSFELSLIYLGKTKKRIKKFFDGDFTAQLVEDCLLELNSESTLPPQIFIYGKADEAIVEDLKNFPWIGKKNVETFLHFPEIKLYQDHDLINIFFKAITSQMLGGGDPTHQAVPPIESKESPESEELVETVEETEPIEEPEPITETEDLNEGPPENLEIENFEKLEEVPFEDLGFFKDQAPPEPIKNEISSDNLVLPPPIIEDLSPLKPEKTPISFNLPKLKFKFPKLKSNFLLFVPFLALIILFLPVIVSKADLILFVNPYEFDKTINITLDSEASDLSASVIPVDKKNITIKSSVTINTTGKKTVGNKATGEVTVFNKLEKVQNIPKGSILIDSKNQEFELISAVQIASSSTDFNTGTMVFGQVKTVISASEIGTEYNINKDNALRFKDFPETSVIVKSNADFTGGSKNEINAVSQQDKINAEAQLTQKLKDLADERINQDFNTSNDVLKETIQTKKSKTELNREIGEETDDLTATSESTVSVLVFRSDLKDQILSQFLSKEAGYSDSEINPDSFIFTLEIDKLDSTKATGSLNIKGYSLPKVDTELLKKNIAGKLTKKAEDIIRKTSRVYDFNLKINLKIFDIMPFSSKNIFIDVKTEK